MAQDPSNAGGNSYTLDDVTFPVGRSKLQSIFNAVRSTNKGSSAPDLVAGQFWIDDSGGSSWIMYFYDGSNNIQFATIDTSANTVNFTDSAFDLIVDTTPQLGGSLDVNGNAIISTSNANITITPNGSGKVVLDGISHPTADGTNGQVLTTNGAGVLSFTDKTVDTTNVVSDTSPQLGGNLDLNSNDITGTGNINFTGNVVLSGTVDGRDIATDGTKLDGIEASATADQSASEIRTLVDSASDSNVFTDADHTKLNAIEASADVTDTANVTAAGALMDSEVTNLADVKSFDTSDYATSAQGTLATNALPKSGGTMTGNIVMSGSETVDGRDISSDGSKLDGIESGATADQTNAEIRTAVEAATDSNVFTDADHSKLNGIESSATADQTDAEIRTAVDAASDSNVFTDADHTKLNGIETGATADQTSAEIKTAVQAESDIALAGNPTTTTQTAGNNSTRIATTAFVQTATASLVDSAPSALNTLNELAAALGDDANFSTTVSNSIGTKLPLAGGTMTGNIVMSGSETVDGRDLSADGSKLDGIEASATADQTASEIRTLVESATDSNVFTDADHTKLNGIETSADVTDTANVTSAGALMDSEVTNLSDVKSFDPSDYATAAQGTLATNALPKSGGTMTGNLTMGANEIFLSDNGQIRLGDSEDLQIFHDGNDSVIKDHGAGALEVRATDFRLNNSANNKNMIKAFDGGDVSLYYDNNLRLQTSNAGVGITGGITVTGTVDGRDIATDGTKLDGIEASATADQTASEIRSLVDSASDSNVFTDADHSKLNGIAAGATNVTNTNQLTNGAGFITATLSNEQVQDIVGGMVSSNTESGITVTYQDGDGTLDFSVASQTDNNFTDADHTKLNGIETNATADQTGAEIKSAYEGESNTNAFTDSLLSKLNGIEASADVTDATNVNAAGAIMNSDVATKGQLIVGDGSGDPTILSVGADGLYLKADSSASSGVAWASVSSGGGGGISDIVEDTSPQLGGNLDTNGNLILFGDSTGASNNKLQFGNSQDLEIYHDGNNSRIQDIGTGNLLVRGTNLRLQDADGYDYIACNDGGNGGTVFLKHLNSTKLETASGGISVTGNIVVSGTVDGVDIASRDGILTSTTTTANAALPKAGGAMTGAITSAGDFTVDVAGDILLDAAGSDIRMISNGTDFCKFTKDGNNTAIKSQVSDGDLILRGSDGGSQIDALRLDMSQSGKATFSNDIALPDNGKAVFGGNDDLEIFHESANNRGVIKESGTGDLHIRANDLYLKSTDNSNTYAYFVNGGAAALYHNNSVKLTTSSTGVSVTGALVASGNVTAFSSKKLKSDIKTIDNALEKVNQMRGVTFTKDNEKGSGVIAEELEQVAPELVVDGEYKSVAYGNTVGYLIEAIKELKAEIEELKKDK